MITAKDTRRDVEARYGAPISDAAYREFRTDFRDVEINPAEIDELVALLQGVLGDPSTKGSSKHGPPEAWPDPSDYDPALDQVELARLGAVSEAVAAVIDREVRSVRWFREAHLPEGLLEPDDVERWIQSQLDGWSPAPGAADARWLVYTMPGDTHRRETLVPKWSALGKLKLLAENLAQRFACAEAHLTTFVLTGGEAPPVRPIVVLDVHVCRDYTATSRVTVRFDPTLTPAQLARWWRRNRGLMVPSRAYRPMLVKTYRLVQFTVRRSDEETWAQTMDRWNQSLTPKQHADGWSYYAWRRFRADASRGRSQVLRPTMVVDDVEDEG